jgi:hypothetical protein
MVTVLPASNSGRLPRLSGPRRRAAGFTLVELMVAITGGLFASIIVFSISKNSARFYQSETRVGEATLAGIVGFERLRADIARAGFLASPNILVDQRVCAGPATVVGFPPLLATLAAVRVTQDATQAPNNADQEQDSILLAGSYSSVDYFAMRAFGPANVGYSVTLDPASGAMTRLGYTPDAAGAALLSSIFIAKRAVRIVDRSDRHYYGIVTGVNVDTPTAPEIRLAANPTIQTQQSGTLCGIDQCTGCVINVVNFIRYDVSSLSGDTRYAPLYDPDTAAPFDNTRMELRRVELDPTVDDGSPLTDPNNNLPIQELVTQYAVDLEFGLLFDNRALVTDQPALLAIAPGGDLTPAQPGRIRGVRVRVGVRTRDADREVDIDPATPGLSPGLYRVGVGANGGPPFARVRTLQADVMLNNTASFPW